MIPTNKNIKLGDVIGTGVFISGTKYFKLNSAVLYGETYTEGTKVCYFDTDTNKTYKGRI